MYLNSKEINLKLMNDEWHNSVNSLKGGLVYHLRFKLIFKGIKKACIQYIWLNCRGKLNQYPLVYCGAIYIAEITLNL